VSIREQRSNPRTLAPPVRAGNNESSLRPRQVDLRPQAELYWHYICPRWSPSATSTLSQAAVLPEASLTLPTPSCAAPPCAQPQPDPNLPTTAPPALLLLLLLLTILLGDLKDVLMSSLRNFLGSKRTNKSSSQTPTQSTPPPTATTSQSPRQSIANSSTTSLPSGTPTPTGTMNPNQPNQLGRPPSYTYTQQLNPGQPPQGQRPHSPLPPINTSTAPPAGYPPQQLYQQPAQGPPGYATQPQQGGYGAPGYQQPPSQAPVGPQSYNRPGAVEVEAAGRSKAQLIVGIDFVGTHTCSMTSTN
jgi:hypothetical protein